MGQAFRDRVVWVTGASSGIGRALAREFGRAGATLVLSARRAERLEELAADLAAGGVRTLVAPCDVRDEAALERTVAQAIATFGHLDVAVASAGIRLPGRVEELGAAAWRLQLDVNVVGAALTARAALPALRQRRGRLVLIGSVVSMLAMPRTVAYVASKHALRALGASLAIDLHGSGVSCTTIHPGFVDTEIAGPEAGRPGRLLWSSERAARAMLPAIARRRRECVISAHGRLTAFAGRHLPQLVHLAQVTRTLRRPRPEAPEGLDRGAALSPRPADRSG